MKSMKYQECDTIMDNYNPVPPPLPRRVPPVRNIYAEPFETNTSRWVKITFFFYVWAKLIESDEFLPFVCS